MSQESINSRLIKSNIDLLTRLIKRPMVTEKLLSRPPFRFLFDLTTLIIKTTGYLRGLYSEQEFVFENVSINKEAKIAFLDKLIDVIGFINSKAIDVKASKIVAGLEVDKTNRLLNEFANAALDKKPFLDSVDKVRKGQKPPPPISSGASGLKPGATGTRKMSTVGLGKQSKLTAGTGTNRKTSLTNNSGITKPTKNQPPATKKPLSKGAATKTVAQTENKPDDQVQSNLNQNQPMVVGTSVGDDDDDDVDEQIVSPTVDHTANTKQNLVEHQEKDNNKTIEENPSTNFPSNNSDDEDDGGELSDDQQKKADTAIVQRPTTSTKVDLRKAVLSNDTEQNIANGEIVKDTVDIVTDVVEHGDGKQVDSINQVESLHSNNDDNHNNIKEQSNGHKTQILNNKISNWSSTPIEQQINNNENDHSDHNSVNDTIAGDDEAPVDDGGEQEGNFPIKPNRNELKAPPPSAVATVRKSVRSRGASHLMRHNQSSSAAPITLSGTGEGEPMVSVPTAINQSTTSTRSARPTSSRPAPPRVMTASRSRLSHVMETRMEQISNGNGGGGSSGVLWPPSLNTNDTKHGDDDDDDADDFVISSKKLQDSLLLANYDQQDGDTKNGTVGTEKGSLVQQLLATKTELEGKTDDSVVGTDISSQASQSPWDESHRLRSLVQELCQSIGTLSKALGYLHEDVEPMMNELARWHTEYRENLTTIDQIRGETDKQLQPLKSELEQIERELTLFQDKLKLTKSVVYRNNQLIAKLIESV